MYIYIYIYIYGIYVYISMVYMCTTPHPQIFFYGGLKIFFVSCSQWQGKFQISRDLLYWGTNFEIFSLRIFCLFKCPLKLLKQCLLLFGNNSAKVWILFDMSSE